MPISTVNDSILIIVIHHLSTTTHEESLNDNRSKFDLATAKLS